MTALLPGTGTPTAPAGAGPTLREVLPNGLTLLVRPDARFGRVALSVVYRVGFRADPPGRDGLAHLIEHMMFTGSRALPGNRLVTAVSEAGGAGSATTHQDYTEFHQLVPAALLDRVLFGEADRMAAPTLSEAGLAQQVHGVVQEIEELHDRPLGGFPWPMISPLVLDHAADTHDPYGSSAAVAGYTIEDCRRFVAEHYHPANAVLAVVGDVDPDRVASRVHRHFAGIGSRPASATTGPAAAPVATASAGRSAVRHDPHLREPALALGFVLPDPLTDRRGYLAAAVAARTIADAERADASSGFFDLLDARAPDALVLAGSAPAGAARADVLCRRVEALSDHATADPALSDTALREAARRILADRQRAAADLQRTCHDLARWEALFGPRPVAEEPALLLASLTPREIRAAAGRLADQRPARLLLVPGPREPRPAVTLPAAPPVLDTTWDPLDPRVPGPGPWPDSVPSVAEPELGDLAGIPVVVVPDDRVGEVELRARVRLPDATGAAVRSAGLSAGAARRRTRGPWPTFAVESDGSDLIVTGRAPRERCADWVRLLDGWLLATASDPGGDVAGAGPEHRADDALRAALAARHPGRAGELSVRCLTAVGPVTPGELTGAGGPALNGTGPAAPFRDRPDPGPVDVTVPVADRSGFVLLSWPVCGLAVDDPRLTAALVVLNHRLLAAAGGRHPVAVGCRPVLDGLRVEVRAATGIGDQHRIAGELAAAARGMVERPVTAVEVSRAASQAAGLALVPFDSPANLADSLCAATAWRAGAVGSVVDRLVRTPHRLASLEHRRVADVAATLFAPQRPASVVTTRSTDRDRLGTAHQEEFDR